MTATRPGQLRAPRTLGRERLGRELRRRRGLRATGVQLVYLLAAVALGLAVPEIPIGFTVSSGRVIEALVAVGIGIVTFIGVVYSLLFLVVQFGTTTFTPRLNLFRDAPIVWHAFGYFAGIMVFSFTAAFSIGAGDEQITGLVPIMLAVMLLAALAALPPAADDGVPVDPACVDARAGRRSGARGHRPSLLGGGQDSARRGGVAGRQRAPARCHLAGPGGSAAGHRRAAAHPSRSAGGCHDRVLRATG
jgi:hypothetical protein